MAKMKPGDFCPLIKKDCVGLKCSWYTQMRGTNPNTGEPVDEWACAIAWMPIMAVEIAQKSNQTGAAVESFRNEVVKGNQQNQQLYIQALQQGVVPTQVTPLNPPLNILESGEIE
jgi:hypothetical protein